MKQFIENLKKAVRYKIKKALMIDTLEQTVARDSIRLSQVEERYSRMESTWQQATAEIQDIAMKGNTQIVITSNLGAGYCRFYNIEFKDFMELMDFVEHVKSKQVCCMRPIIDAPAGYVDFVQHEERKRGGRREFKLTRGYRDAWK